MTRRDGPTVLVFTRPEPAGPGPGQPRPRRGRPAWRIRPEAGLGQPGGHTHRNGIGGPCRPWTPPAFWRMRVSARRSCPLPSWELFDAQSAEYRNSVLPPAVRARVSIGGRDPARLGAVRGRRGHRGRSSVVRGVGAVPDNLRQLRTHGPASGRRRSQGWRDHGTGHNEVQGIGVQGMGYRGAGECRSRQSRDCRSFRGRMRACPELRFTESLDIVGPVEGVYLRIPPPPTGRGNGSGTAPRQGV